MNKKELISILKERTLVMGTTSYEKVGSTTSAYLKKISVRRKIDNNNLYFISLISMLIFLLFLSFYKLERLKNDLDSKKYIKKDNLVFSSLDQKIQEKYISKDTVSVYQKQLSTFDKEYIKKLKKEESTINSKNLELNVQLARLLKNNKSLENKLLLKVSDGDANQTKLTKYKSTGCYDEIIGSNVMNNNCKLRIKQFLKINSKSLKYEIIAISDTKDKKFIDGRINKIASKNEQELLKKYLTEGLARTRVLEGAWFIKKELGKKVLITYVNYIAETNNKRGFTVRAYYR